MFIRKSKRAHCSGLTLMETVFGVALSALVIAAVLTFTFYTSRSFAMIFNYSELESQSRSALDRMSREIRQSLAVTSFQTNKLVLEDRDLKPLTFTFSAADRTLSREKDGVSEVYLSGCDSLEFDLFQRNPVDGAYDQYPASLVTSNAKVVQITWTCSRDVIGAKMNTESVQTAKIVIRNR